MSGYTSNREYPIPSLRDYRWDIYLSNALGQIDDDVSTLLDESGGGSFSGSHNDLSDVSSGDHHTKYTDSEAQSAVTTFSGSHGDLNNVSSGDHHTKYTDSNAQSAVDGTDRTFTSVTINDIMSISPKSSVPSSPSANDVYLDDGTNTSSGNPGLRYYDGSAWNDL